MGDGVARRIRTRLPSGGVLTSGGKMGPVPTQEGYNALVERLGPDHKKTKFYKRKLEAKAQGHYDKKFVEPSTTEKSNMAAVKEPINKTNLNQLTETVIQENNTSIAEQTDPVRIKEKLAPVTPMPTVAANPSAPSPQDMGSHDAVPKIKLSPYFVEYTKTSSY